MVMEADFTTLFNNIKRAGLPEMFAEALDSVLVQLDEQKALLAEAEASDEENGESDYYDYEF